MFCDAVVETKFTVVTGDPLPVVPLTNPVPVTVNAVPPVTGPCVTERALTVGLVVLIVELLIVMPLPQVPLGGDRHTPGLIVGLLDE